MSIRPRRATRLGFCLLAAAALSAVLPAALSAAVFRVGAGAGCTHPDLPSALTAAAANPGFDEIQLLANSNHQGQIIVFTDGLFLRGGFASCGAASPTGTSTLLGDNSNRALFLAVAGGMILERLNITGGSVTGDGGGLFIQGTGAVNLIGVLVFGNSATGRGGNVHIAGSAGLSVSFDNDSLVAAGDATDGGGLSCSGDAVVSFAPGTVVANNVASDDGGGVHLAAGCALNSNAGGSSGGILTNVASGDGGGAYIEGGAELNTFLAADGLAAIEGNSATNGGGAFVTGTGSALRAYFARVSGNQASAAGGAVFADADAGAGFARATGENDPCFDGVRCSVVSDNSAVVGGAIHAEDGSEVQSHGTHFEGNSASFFAPVANVESGALVMLRSSVVAANDGSTVFNVSGAGSALTLGNVTLGRNVNYGPGMINLGSAGLGPVRILTSAFDQEGPLFVAGFPAGAAPQLDCVMTRHAGLLAGLPPATVVRAVTIADPRLANPTAGNYQLKGISGAIDFCDTTQWAADNRDIDWQARDIDDPDHPNPLPGFRDLGADEYLVIFADGFESGNTSRWDAVVP